MATPQQVLHDALSLPEADRAAIAARILESLEGPADTDVEAAWEGEIAQRLREIDEGSVKLIPAEEVMREIRGIIDGRAG